MIGLLRTLLVQILAVALLSVGSPLVVQAEVIGTLAGLESAQRDADLARVVFVSASLLMAWLCWRVLAPGALWSQRSGQHEPLRTRQLLRLLLTAHALGLAVLAIAGYFLTAMALAAPFVESAIAVLAISVLLLTSRMQKSSTTMMNSLLWSGSGSGIQASMPQTKPVSPVSPA